MLQAESLPDLNVKYEKYLRGIGEEDLIEDLKAQKIKNELYKHMSDVLAAARSAAQSELLQTLEQGYIKSDSKLTQREIQDEIPFAVANRKFDFFLDHGPYRIDVTENGRTIILGGRKGHVACFDWYTGKRHFEIHPELEIRDVVFLQNSTQSAVATNKAVYTFDKQGVQIHRIDNSSKVFGLQFLPKHWLLVAATESNHIVYNDITEGKMVAKFHFEFPAGAIAQNKSNAVIALGHDRGTISLWTPNDNHPVAKMLNHYVEVSAIDIDIQGNHMAVGHSDGVVQIWDLRQMKVVKRKSFNSTRISDVAFSSKGVLGVARNDIVDIYQDWNMGSTFLTSKYRCNTNQLKFVTFDDFAMVGTENGVSSMIVPGSGEPNIDYNVANPYETVKWRQEQEVKRLLDKIPHEMITLNPQNVFHIGSLYNEKNERTKAINSRAIVSKKIHAEEKKPISMEKKFALMKEAYYKMRIEEKLARKHSEGMTKLVSPLSRFSKK